MGSEEVKRRREKGLNVVRFWSPRRGGSYNRKIVGKD